MFLFVCIISRGSLTSFYGVGDMNLYDLRWRKPYSCKIYICKSEDTGYPRVGGYSAFPLSDIRNRPGEAIFRPLAAYPDHSA